MTSVDDFRMYDLCDIFQLKIHRMKTGPWVGSVTKKVCLGNDLVPVTLKIVSNCVVEGHLCIVVTGPGDLAFLALTGSTGGEGASVAVLDRARLQLEEKTFLNVLEDAEPKTINDVANCLRDVAVAFFVMGKDKKWRQRKVPTSEQAAVA